MNITCVYTPFSWLRGLWHSKELSLIWETKQLRVYYSCNVYQNLLLHIIVCGTMAVQYTSFNVNISAHPSLRKLYFTSLRQSTDEYIMERPKNENAMPSHCNNSHGSNSTNNLIKPHSNQAGSIIKLLNALKPALVTQVDLSRHAHVKIHPTDHKSTAQQCLVTPPLSESQCHFFSVLLRVKEACVSEVHVLAVIAVIAAHPKLS